jgi:O-antigen ligase
MPLGILLIATALLLPNHYFPWLAAWSDGLAALGAVAMVISAARSERVVRLSKPLGIFILVLAGSVLLQWTSGQLMFTGDAWMVLLYAGLWLAALLAGQALMGTGTDTSTPKPAHVALPLALLGAGVLSAALALNQWTGALQLGIYMAEMPPGGRPFANLAQPNNFCTLSFLALCSLLVLHQGRLVGTLTLWLGAALLLLSMALSQSRTGWLQVGFLLVWVWAMRDRVGLRLTRGQVVGMGGLYAGAVWLLPLLNEMLLLGDSRTLGDQLRAGLRLPYWHMMVDAISQQPWTGYGWTQVGAAQQAVALRHPALGEFFEHAHNFVLDLFLWVGIPLGLILLGSLAWWAVQQVRRCTRAPAAWWLVAIAGLMIHGMLELPLEYAYFLVPLGLMMGAVQAGADGPEQGVIVSKRALWTLAGVLTVMLAITARDYLGAEENHRTLRLESARIGTAVLATLPPDLTVLTQLEAFLQFARIEATPGMPPQQVDWMRRVATRFGYPSVMFRYALVAGLNGQPDAASLTLQRLCRIHNAQRCAEARESWAALQQRYPQLNLVKIPDQ